MLHIDKLYVNLNAGIYLMLQITNKFIVTSSPVMNVTSVMLLCNFFLQIYIIILFTFIQICFIEFNERL